MTLRERASPKHPIEDWDALFILGLLTALVRTKHQGTILSCFIAILAAIVAIPDRAIKTRSIANDCSSTAAREKAAVERREFPARSRI